MIALAGTIGTGKTHFTSIHEIVSGEGDGVLYQVLTADPFD